MSTTAPTQLEPIYLPPLREEISIFRGPAAADGSPTWTLHEPVRNRFFRVGWSEFEILVRWESGTADRLTDRLDSETTLRIDDEDVRDIIRFLSQHDLLRVSSAQATDRMVEKAKIHRQSWLQWLFHNYLFMRIPLIRPDQSLNATAPYLSWVFSRGFALSIFAIGFLGLFLVARQWDSFVGTFVDFLTLRGIVWFAVTLSCLKVFHELGHAYTAKHFGCRVPTMGLALLVMVPVLYTDLNETWKLASRRRRLAVGLAGVTTELCCAAIATCLWGFLDDGPARSAAFLVSTSTWLTTVLLNLSPFMRYDGYFVLSDWLEMPNLHDRAFALARWWTREKILGLSEPAPESFPEGRRRFLILFSLLTWAYRFSLFVGIAALVYHFAFKLAGIAMMMAEVGFFIVRPVYREALVWWKHRAEVHWNKRTMTGAALATAFLLLLAVPWGNGIQAPALLKSKQHVDVFVPEFGARIEVIDVQDGAVVDKDAHLAQLTSPDLDYRIRRTQSDIDVLKWETQSTSLVPELLARTAVTAQQTQATLAEYRGFSDQKARLDIAAPIAGRIVDIADNLVPGTWMPAKSKLFSIIDPTAVVEAYVEEADLARIDVDTRAEFVAQADPSITLKLRVVTIARASAPTLSDPALASVYGGPILVRQPKTPQHAGQKDDLVPERTLYRITLAPDGVDYPLAQVLRGNVILHGESSGILKRVWRTVLGVLIRESGA